MNKLRVSKVPKGKEASFARGGKRPMLGNTVPSAHLAPPWEALTLHQHRPAPPKATSRTRPQLRTRERAPARTGATRPARDWASRTDAQATMGAAAASAGLQAPLIATETKLMEAGATTHEIAAVTGHMSLEEIERYTRANSW